MQWLLHGLIWLFNLSLLLGIWLSVVKPVFPNEFVTIHLEVKTNKQTKPNQVASARNLQLGGLHLEIALNFLKISLQDTKFNYAFKARSL